MSKKEKALINFKKAKTLLEKIAKMTEKDDYCVDIMQQNLAAIGLLKSAHHLLMEGHLNSCFKGAMSSKSNGKQQKMIDEIIKVSKLSNR